MAQSALPSGLWEAFINHLYSSGGISVPGDFHSRCSKIEVMLDNDISGIVSTIMDYSINSAAEAILKVECSDDSLENLLNLWLSKININIDGIPTGLQELAKEYYKERWTGSSLCLMRVSNWEKISIGATTIIVPTVLWYVNGASVYIDRKKGNYKLGTDKYYLDKNKKIKVPRNDKEKIFVQKPFARWFTEYPSPYLVKKGVLKNWMAMEVLSSKGDEAISKVLPYLFKITKGDKDVFMQKDVDYTDPELTILADKFKEAVKRYNKEKGKIPANVTPFDQKYEHLIPDLLPILKEELYKQGNRALMAGLGFADMLEITKSRQETRLNPKPFISEVNAGVADFKSMLLDTIRLIVLENKIDHRKLFSDNKSLKIVNSPLKINVQSILDSIRSGFVYGAITIETYQETLGIDPEQELQRMRKEWKDGLRDIYYPHVIQNTEKDQDTNISPVPLTKKQIEKKNEKEKASEQLIVKCKKCGYEFDYLSISESGMGYVKCPECEEAVTQEDLETAPYKNLTEIPKYIKKMTEQCQKVFMATFNSVLEDSEDESKAMAIGISAAKRCMKKAGYTYDKKSKTWKKK